MSKTTDHVIERMNEQLDELLGPIPSHSKFWIEAEIKKLYDAPWFPGQGGKIRKLEIALNRIELNKNK